MEPILHRRRRKFEVQQGQVNSAVALSESCHTRHFPLTRMIAVSIRHVMRCNGESFLSSVFTWASEGW